MGVSDARSNVSSLNHLDCIAQSDVHQRLPMPHSDHTNLQPGHLLDRHVLFRQRQLPRLGRLLLLLLDGATFINIDSQSAHCRNYFRDSAGST